MITIVRPPASRALASFYRTLAVTLLADRLAAGQREVRLIEKMFGDQVDERPDVVLLSLYIDDVRAGLRELERLKRRWPDVKAVVGGPHMALLGPRAYEISPHIDHIAVGDCLDIAIPAIEALDRGENVSSRYFQAVGPATFAMPTYSLWDDTRHFPVFPVELSRGCRHRCPFCSDPVLRRGAMSRGGDATLEVLRALCNAHGQVFIRFVDSSFSSMRPDIDVLLRGIVAEELPVRWSAYAYASDLDAQLVDLMRSSGCTALFFGMESLSPDVMTGTRFTRDADRLEATLQMLAEADIFAHCNVIVGLPGETRDTLRLTIDRITALAPDSVGGGPFYLTPGSTFHRRPERFGIKILDENWILRQHETFDEPGHEYFATDTLSQSAMWELADEFRAEITRIGESCWNLSDYALICWEAVGGKRQRLEELWQADEGALADDERLVIQVLKEKVGTEVASDKAADFVGIARRVAAR